MSIWVLLLVFGRIALSAAPGPELGHTTLQNGHPLSFTVSQEGPVVVLFDLASSSRSFFVSFAKDQHISINFANGLVSYHGSVNALSGTAAPQAAPFTPGLYWMSILNVDQYTFAEVGTGGQPGLHLLGHAVYPIINVTSVGVHNVDWSNDVVLNYLKINPQFEWGATTLRNAIPSSALTAAKPGYVSVVFEIQSGGTQFEFTFLSLDTPTTYAIRYSPNQLSLFLNGWEFSSFSYNLPAGPNWFIFSKDGLSTGTGSVPGEQSLSWTVLNSPSTVHLPDPVFTDVTVTNQDQDHPLQFLYVKADPQSVQSMGRTAFPLPATFYWNNLKPRTPGSVNIVFKLESGGSNFAFGFASSSPTITHWPATDSDYCMVQYYQGQVYLRFNDGYVVANTCYLLFSPGVYWITFSNNQLSVGRGPLPGESVTCSATIPYSYTFKFTDISFNNGDYTTPVVLDYVSLDGDMSNAYAVSSSSSGGSGGGDGGGDDGDINSSSGGDGGDGGDENDYGGDDNSSSSTGGDGGGDDDNNYNPGGGELLPPFQMPPTPLPITTGHVRIPAGARYILAENTISSVSVAFRQSSEMAASRKFSLQFHSTSYQDLSNYTISVDFLAGDLTLWVTVGKTSIQFGTWTLTGYENKFSVSVMTESYGPVLTIGIGDSGWTVQYHVPHVPFYLPPTRTLFYSPQSTQFEWISLTATTPPVARGLDSMPVVNDSRWSAWKILQLAGQIAGVLVLLGVVRYLIKRRRARRARLAAVAAAAPEQRHDQHDSSFAKPEGAYIALHQNEEGEVGEVEGEGEGQLPVPVMISEAEVEGM